MPSICVYGTVYNSVSTIERSIRSVFDPSYTLVIVDNKSTDGTWEKLQELKKEFNLILLRLKSTRGKGRNYALMHCPENSITAFFDLDTVYNENFHKILKSEITGIDVGTLIVKKEDAVKRGGWRDLNAGEDYEFKVRVGFKYFLPVIVDQDQKVKGLREARYAKRKVFLLYRLLKKYIDSTRALNYSIQDLLSLYRGIYKPLSILLYPIPLLLGKYSYEKGVNNFLLYGYKSSMTLTNPNDLGLRISDDFIVVEYPYPFLLFRHDRYVLTLEQFEKLIAQKLGKMLRFNFSGHIIYAKNEKGFRIALESLYFS